MSTAANVEPLAFITGHYRPVSLKVCMVNTGEQKQRWLTDGPVGRRLLGLSLCCQTILQLIVVFTSASAAGEIDSTVSRRHPENAKTTRLRGHLHDNGTSTKTVMTTPSSIQTNSLILKVFFPSLNLKIQGKETAERRGINVTKLSTVIA